MIGRFLCRIGLHSWFSKWGVSWGWFPFSLYPMACVRPGCGATRDPKYTEAEMAAVVCKKLAARVSGQSGGSKE